MIKLTNDISDIRIHEKDAHLRKKMPVYSSKSPENNFMNHSVSLINHFRI